ncbi:MAG: V-type ATP synthase subunit E [Chloroflexota bacterium]|nr:V-type ATP synthase subunit E [Chloroflexota bacterium]
MSLGAILEAIFASGDSRVSEIKEQASKEAQRIIAEAKVEGQRLEDAARNATTAPAYRERAQKLEHARLESLQIVGQERESLVDEALTLLRGRLSNIRNAYSYRTILRELVVEALDELTGSLDDDGIACINADDRDRAQIVEILAGFDQPVEVTYDLNSWGGVIAHDKENVVTVINTLEARLERSITYLRHYLGAIFMDQQSELMLQRVDKKQPVP